MCTARPSVAKYRVRRAQAPALGASLVLSAALTAVALRAPGHYWLVWVSLLPIFAAVRWLRPSAAVPMGALWGAGLYLFYTSSSAPTPAPSLFLLALLTAIPAVYVGLAALPARTIGCKLLTLALGWTLIEAVLHVHNPTGPAGGFLAGSPAESVHLHWFARLVGCLSTAFLVACANASVVSILSNPRLGLPASRSLPKLPKGGASSPTHAVLAVQSWPPRQAWPRAPPTRIARVSRYVVGRPHPLSNRGRDVRDGCRSAPMTLVNKGKRLAIPSFPGGCRRFPSLPGKGVYEETMR